MRAYQGAARELARTATGGPRAYADGGMSLACARYIEIQIDSRRASLYCRPMRRIYCFVALIAFSTAALGQGQFVFNNRVPPDVNARFQLCTDAPGVSSIAGDAYTVQ